MLLGDACVLQKTNGESKSVGRHLPAVDYGHAPVHSEPQRQKGISKSKGLVPDAIPGLA
jgi:hypothetical protein